MELHKRPKHEHVGTTPFSHPQSVQYAKAHRTGSRGPQMQQQLMQQQLRISLPQAGGAAAAGGSAAPSGSTGAFATFASEYKDVLQFADADEAEAVFGMVSLGKDAAGWQVRCLRCVAVALDTVCVRVCHALWPRTPPGASLLASVLLIGL